MEISLHPSSDGDAQALRRACMTLVPTLSVHMIRVQRNDTPTIPERLLEQMFLVPLHADPAPYLEYLLCTCDSFCVRCSLRGLIDVGPGRVTSSAMGPLAMPDLPLTHVRPGGRLVLEWIAVRGTGWQHLKFSAVASCAVARPIPRIAPLVDIEALQTVCPQKLFTRSEILVRKCTYCGMCKDKARVVPSTTEFLLQIESIGVVPEPRVRRDALLGLADLCTKLAAALPSPEPRYNPTTPPTRPAPTHVACPQSPTYRPTTPPT